MTPPLSLDTLERTVLGLVTVGDGRFGWHDLASRLAALDLPRQPDLMEVLADLQERGLVVRLLRDRGTDLWAPTTEGAAVARTDASAAAADAPPATSGPQALVEALRAGPALLVQRLGTLLADVPRYKDLLRRALAEVPGAADAIATGILLLPEADRADLAREMATSPQQEIRRALFRAWAPAQLDRQGTGWQSLPEPDWDAVLRAGLTDHDGQVRADAAALVFATARADRFVPELLASLEGAHLGLKWRALLALGSAHDETSLASLRAAFDGREPSLAAAAVRALAARADGRHALVEAASDPREEVRAAAAFAIAHVAEGLDDADVRALARGDRPEPVRVAAAAYRARTKTPET